MQQVHVHFPQLPSAFAVVAARAGRHYIGPDVLPAQVFGQHVVHRQVAGVPAAVLAGIAVPPEYLPAGLFDLQARPVDHFIQPDD